MVRSVADRTFQPRSAPRRPRSKAWPSAGRPSRAASTACAPSAGTRSKPGLKGSVGDRSNHSNFSHQNSVNNKPRTAPLVPSRRRARGSVVKLCSHSNRIAASPSEQRGRKDGNELFETNKYTCILFSACTCYFIFRTMLCGGSLEKI